MDVDDHAVGADRDRGARERYDEVLAAGGVGRVDDDRQVAGRLDDRHRGDVEGVAGRRLEGADAALAQDDVEVAALGDVLRRHQPLLDGRRHAALEQHRLAGLADGLQQPEVRHVAGADLQHVGVLGDDGDVARVDDLGDDRQPGRLADVGEDLAGRRRPRPWKAYGEVRGLNAPPRRIVAPADFAICAASRVCSADSTAHGPAMKVNGVRADRHLVAGGGPPRPSSGRGGAGG